MYCKQCRREHNRDGNLQTSLLDMHKDVSECIDTNCKRAIVSHNAEKNLIGPELIFRDFLTMCKETWLKYKPTFCWCRSYRILTVIGLLAYVPKDVITFEIEIVFLHLFENIQRFSEQ